MIDIYNIGADYKFNKDYESYAHLSLDAIPFGTNKIRAIDDLCGDNMDTKMAFLFDISLYHSRWNELNKNDFTTNFTCEKGAETRINVADVSLPTIISEDEVRYVDTAGTDYLKKMIEYCQKRNIEVLLTCVPYLMSDNDQKIANGAQKIADDYDINYINFMHEDIVDFLTDSYDNNGYSHMNASGGKKLTKYIGEYILNNYDIQGQNDLLANKWNKDYDKYQNMKLNNLYSNVGNMYNYIMLASDENLDVEMTIGDISQVENDPKLKNLLINLGYYSDTCDKIEEILTQRKPACIYIDNSSNEINITAAQEIDGEISIKLFDTDTKAKISEADF